MNRSKVKNKPILSNNYSRIDNKGLGKEYFAKKLLSHFMALRPRQWTKNLIVFAAPLFSFSIDRASLLGSLLAFILFCGTSSAFYLFNDVADLESDRRHPIKCKRPIASGLVSVPVAIILAISLLITTISVSFHQSLLLGSIIIGYCLIQVAYNLKLKHKPILDIIAIASGFVMRACAGGAATNVNLSVWFILCTAMLSLFLAVEKRKAELRSLKAKVGKTRAVLKRYSLSLLSRIESVVTNGTLITYALWSSGPQVNGASTHWMMLTFPFVLYGVFRYQLLSDSEQVREESEYKVRTERPEEVLLTDKPILFNVIAWGVTVFLILWLKSQGIIQ